MRSNFTCSFSIEAVGDDTYLGKYDVMDSTGQVVDRTDKGTVHESALAALHAAEERARLAAAALEHARLVA